MAQCVQEHKHTYVSSYLFVKYSNNESWHEILYFNLSLQVYSDTMGMGWEEKVVPVLINKAPHQEEWREWESGSTAAHFLKSGNWCRRVDTFTP